MWGSDATNVWAVGDGGTILKWNGGAWSPQISGTAQFLYGVWGGDATNVWAVGNGGTIKAGVVAGIGGGLGVDLPVEPYARSADWDHARVIEDPGDASWRRYPVQELAFVELRRCLSANELRMQPHDRKAQVYGLGDRSLTESARALLRACYPDLYQERNFEKRWYSFIYR